MPAPDEPSSSNLHRSALDQYRRRAPYYDLELALFEPIRRTAIERLALRAGDIVLDLGCGTGLSLEGLRQAIGERGHIVGIEQSAPMLAQARKRVGEAGWRNVTLVEAPCESAAIAVTADAALFHFTHDILQAPAALDNVAHHLRPGARVVATGLQWAGPWAWPQNLFVLGAALHSMSSLDGLARPWHLLAEELDEVHVDTLLGGAVYLAGGTRRNPERRLR